jgi:hypothetical protein
MVEPHDELVQQIELYRRQAYWEPWKAVAMILLAAAAITGAGQLASHLWPQPTPQSITVHIINDKK